MEVTPWLFENVVGFFILSKYVDSVHKSNSEGSAWVVGLSQALEAKPVWSLYFYIYKRKFTNNFVIWKQ